MEPAWLTARRERAVALSGELELPSFRGTPGWEFTSLKGLELDSFEPARDGDVGLLGRAEAVLAAPDDAITAGQVDGAFSAPAQALPEGVTVCSLEHAAQEHPELVEAHLGTLVEPADPFTARNERDWSAGVLVHVARNVTLEQPIVISAVQGEHGAAMSWRSLVVLEEGASAEVWEQYSSSAEDHDGLFNAVTELIVGQNASLRHVCAQALSEKAWVFASQRAVVQRDGSLDWIALGLGGSRGRIRMDTQLAGPGSHAKVTGASATRGRQHLDYATTQEHAAPDTNSDLAFRGILDGRSTSVWSGMIKVDPGAQRIDAFQESRNLLLSKTAHADAIPGLEILADDVRCTHAAAIAQIDPEQLFYLRSRGLREPQARRLVIEGFLQATVERFAEGPLREAVHDALDRRLALILG